MQAPQEKEVSIEKYFDTTTSLKDRDKNIKKAIKDGYKQSEIAGFLNLSRTTISKIVAKVGKLRDEK